MRIYQPVDGPDRLPQAMVEGSTEYDWADLPEWLKDIMRNAAKEFAHWADNEHEPLKGELANELTFGAGHGMNKFRDALGDYYDSGAIGDPPKREDFPA